MAIQYPVLDHSQDEIRVLEILGGNRNEMVTCNFRIQKLVPESESFLALSYMWSFESPSIVPKFLRERWKASTSVSINGRGTVDVTPNLYSALLELRKSDKSMSIFIWIDQICINQRDYVETTHQIKLMGKLYATAAKTIVWIGRDTNHSLLGINRFRLLRNQIEHRIDESHVLLRRYLQPTLFILDTSAFFRFLRNPYFSRVWIVQEIALSREVEFRSCHTCLSLQRLTEMAAATTSCELGPRHAGNFLKIMGLRCHVLKDHSHSLENGGWIVAKDITKDIFGILSMFRNNRATKMRDQIYGFLGVCRAIENGWDFGIVEDTSTAQSCEDIYLKAATAMLRDKRSVDILAAVRYQSGSWQAKGIPSWVPDWGDSKHVTSPIHTLCADVGAWEPELEFSHTRHPKITLPNAMRLFGYEIDYIIDLSIRCNTEASSPGIRTCLESGYKTVGSHRMQVLCDWWRQFSTSCATAEALTCAITCGRYKSDSAESVTHFITRYQRRALTERSAKDLKAIAFLALQYLIELYILPPRTVLSHFVIPQLVALPLAFFCFNYRCLKAYPYVLLFKANKWEGEFYSEGLNRIEGRRAAKLHKGAFALVPQEAEIGDQIFVCAGAKCPLLLRGLCESVSGAEFQLVGECYVHVVMENFEAERCDSIWIV